MIHCDNQGAIYLENNQETRRSKHIDIKYHVVREYIKNDVIKILFVKTNDNREDPFTKNVGSFEHDKHYSYLSSVNADTIPEQGGGIKGCRKIMNKIVSCSSIVLYVCKIV